MENVYLSQTETLIARTISDNIALFTEGVVDWNRLRDFAISQCVDYHLSRGTQSPVAKACQANSVDRTHYYRAKIAQTAYIM